MKRARAANEIKAVLVRKGLNIKSLAADLGVSHTLVSRTIRGEINNRQVLRALIVLGVPRRFLDLPADLQVAA